MNERLECLTEREREVLRLLVQGHDGKSIAHALSLSVHTVHERLREARRKLEVSSSREAARLLRAHEEESSKKIGNTKIGVALARPDELVLRTEPPRMAGASPWIIAAGAIMVVSLISILAAISFENAPTRAVDQIVSQTRSNYLAILAEMDRVDLGHQLEGRGAEIKFRLELTPAGQVTGCQITGSSGNTAVDDDACRMLRSGRGLFRPANENAGRAATETVDGKIILYARNRTG